MLKSDTQQNDDNQPADIGKKTYKKPAILSVEKLEVVAATCDGSKTVFTGLDDCGTISPLNS